MSTSRIRDRAVRQAERQSHEGYKEGPVILDGKRAVVTVNFYQGTSWWLDFSDKERVALTPRIWARCESATMNPFRNKLKVIENRNGDAMSFTSERLPGTGGVRHLAVFSHEEASFSRIYRAVPLEGEVPEDVEAAIAGKTGIVLRWDLAGIHFLGTEIHPEIGSPDAGVEP